MTRDPGTEIRTLFAQAALRNEAARGLSGDGWADYQKIQADYADDTRFEERRFLAEYQSRFEAARKRIIDEAGVPERKFAPRWFGRDKFDVGVIDRQADREVRMAHVERLERLRQRRDTSFDMVFAAEGLNPKEPGKVQTAFTRATDRRSGPDRRRGRPR